MPRKDKPFLSHKLRKTREQAGFTRSQLASRIGTTETYIFMLETGRRTNPSIQLLRAWARECGTHIGKML